MSLLTEENSKVSEESLEMNENLRRQTAFRDVLTNHSPCLLGKGMIQLYFACFLMYLVSMSVGYDSSLMGSINAMNEYLTYYNIQKTSSGTGLVFAIFNVGQMTAVALLWIVDCVGRRYSVAIGCTGLIVGTVITSTATDLKTFIAGRFVLSFFGTIASVAAPVYCVEIAPPHMRWALSGLYNTLWFFGSHTAAITCYLSLVKHEGSLLVFRIPLWLQMLCPAFALCGTWFIPETPRFLVGVGKFKEARDVIVTYHCNGEEAHPMADLEMLEIVNSFKDSKLDNMRSLFDFRGLFTTKGNRYRIFLIVCFAWFQQFSGNNIISYYLSILLDSVGITEIKTQILLNAAYAMIGWIFATIGSFLHKYVGRRKMFLMSISGFIVCLSVVSGCIAGFQHKQSKGIDDINFSMTTVIFVFIFGAFFAVGFTPAQPIYPAECSSNKIRAKCMAIHIIVSGLSSFVNLYGAPVAMRNIKYWFCVFFVFWDMIELLVVYFFFVETKDWSLEELDRIFESKEPCKASKASASFITLSDIESNNSTKYA